MILLGYGGLEWIDQKILDFFVEFCILYVNLSHLCIELSYVFQMIRTVIVYSIISDGFFLFSLILVRTFNTEEKHPQIFKRESLHLVVIGNIHINVLLEDFFPGLSSYLFIKVHL